MEAEYFAVSETAKSIVWMGQLLKDVDVISDKKMLMLFFDNQSAIKLIGNHEFHKQSKHIKTKYHFVCLLLAEKRNNVLYTPTEDQVAISSLRDCHQKNLQ